MKKIVFILIIFAFWANVSAQIKVSSSGNVGIGKDPQYKLDVAGDIYIGSASNIFGTTNSNAITFKVNNVLAGFTGNHAQGNVSFGYGSLLNPSAGAYNTAIGSNVLSSNITGGDYNTAIGSSALYFNTSGNHNTANGVCALYLNTTGISNTASGNNALISNTSGNYNTAVGTSALQLNTTGSYNTAIGHHTGAFNPENLTNSTVIGFDATATASNQVRIGNGNVGSIGGYANWSNISDGRAKKNIRADVPGLAFIKRLQPVTYNLDLDAMDNLLGIDKAKKDKLEKEMPQDLKDKNEKAKKAKQDQVQTGFVAQDVEKTAKSIGYNFSGVDVDETGIYGLRYAEFVVPLVKAVQELSEQNDRLQKQVNELAELVYGMQEKEYDLSLLRSQNSNASTTGLPEVSGNGANLYQNSPNPFTEQTEIRYFLPSNIRQAYICIFDMQGKMLQKLNATAGQNSIIINGSTLHAGMYLYSLIADGKEVDTKRMILTK